jgi:NADH-quinone oxidoreductase subunit N
MTPSTILNNLLDKDLPRSLEVFLPEILLCVVIVAMLLLRVIGRDRRLASCWVALLGSLVAFLAVFAQFMYVWTEGSSESGGLSNLYSIFRLSGDVLETGDAYFTGLLMHDQFTLLFRLGLAFFLVLTISLTILTGIPDNEDGPDFYTLLIGSTIGMMVTVSANHLLMLFMGVEMMSVPSYAMVGFLKGRRQSSEAALKYVVYGAGAAGVMLYGASLLAGLLGTADLSAMADRLVLICGADGFSVADPKIVTLMLGIVMILAGLAFKLSLVPFHFWCPDAFEGASAEVAGYLSVASKAAAFALLMRFVLAFQGESQLLRDLGVNLGIGLGVVAIVTTTFGNLAAYTQTNLKRLFAYSTIAHAGFMLMAVSALLVLLNGPAPQNWSVGEANQAAVQSVEGITYYLVVYLFMNLAAFAIVAMFRNETLSEEIDDCRGLIHGGGSTKVLCVCLAIALFSLIGIPPFGGFFAKMMVFAALVKATDIHWSMWVVLIFAGINTVISLFYYIRVIKAVCIEHPTETTRRVHVPAAMSSYVLLITIPIIVLGMTPLQDHLCSTARYVADMLLNPR